MADALATDDPALAAEVSDRTRRLQEQYAEIAQLAGGLAHEIKNPLSTMSLNLDLLVEDLRDAESPRDRRVLKKLERVRRETERLNDIVEDFLRFARVQDLRTEPTDLNALVDDLRDFCEPQAVEQDVVIRTQYDPEMNIAPLADFLSLCGAEDAQMPLLRVAKADISQRPPVVTLAVQPG